MASTRAEMRSVLRDALGDWPYDQAPLAAGVTAAATVYTFAAADIQRFRAGVELQVEAEVCEVRSVNTVANTVTVLRGRRGSTAATHAIATVVWVHGLFTDFVLDRLINQAIRSAWPSVWLEREQLHASVTDTNYDYLLTKSDVIAVYIETGVGDGTYLPIRNCYLRSYVEATEAGVESRKSVLTFNVLPPSGLRIRYTYLGAVGVLGSDGAKLEAEAIYPSLTEYVVMRAASYAAMELRGRRQRFHEFSVAVGDRVADVDTVIRSEFAYRNASDMAMNEMRKPFPAVWPTRRPR